MNFLFGVLSKFQIQFTYKIFLCTIYVRRLKNEWIDFTWNFERKLNDNAIFRTPDDAYIQNSFKVIRDLC